MGNEDKVDNLIKTNEKLSKEISECKIIEEKLKLSEARLEALLKLNQMTEESLNLNSRNNYNVEC